MFTLNAETRKEQGKGASRRLRHNNRIPAIVYGGGEAPIAIILDHDVVMNIQNNPEFYQNTLTLNIDGKATTVKVQAVQRHPFKPKLLHIDFMRA